jgi:uncharacterized protein YcaQ
MITSSLSASEARRIAFSAVGLALPRPLRRGAGALKAVVDRLGQVQIDSVNVFARAHTMPLFSRHGAYDTDHLHELAYGGRKRALFEYWAHEASYLPVALQPMLRWRMARAERGEGIYSGLASFGREQRPFINQVLAQIELFTNAKAYGKKVYVLPKHLDEKVAALHLARIGAKLTKLSQEQADYLGVPVNGPFKNDWYRY